MAYVDSTSAHVGTAGDTLNCAIPAGVAVGDVMVAMTQGTDNASATVAMCDRASGWTEIPSTSLAITVSGTTYAHKAFFRVVDGTEGANATFEWDPDGGNSVNRRQAIIIAFDTPVMVTAIVQSDTDNAGPPDQLDFASRSKSESDADVAYFFVGSIGTDSGVYTETLATGLTKVEDVTHAPATVNNAILCVGAYETLTSADSTYPLRENDWNWNDIGGIPGSALDDCAGYRIVKAGVGGGPGWGWHANQPYWQVIGE